MEGRIRILITILTAALFIVTIALSFSLLKPGGDILAVSANGKRYEFSLKKDGCYSVEGLLGETTIEIKNGKARFTSSPCPNKTCIALGYSRTIACLPNRVIALSSNQNGGGVDAIAR